MLCRPAAPLALAFTFTLAACTGTVPEVGAVRAELDALCTAPVVGRGTVDVENEYLPRVVACENGVADFEALKAQAVAARSYLYYVVRSEQRAIEDGQGDQVYTCTVSPREVHYRAVRETAGQVLTYRNTRVATFFVAGALQSSSSCTGGTNDPTNTERFVTYNEGRTGSSVTQSRLGAVDPSNYANRGCLSQNGSHCLSLAGRDYQSILHFYYGEDITLEHASLTCASDAEPEPDPGYEPESICGDGQSDYGEECDDGNRQRGDGCDDACRVEPDWSCWASPSQCARVSTGAVCGNGVAELGEECDDANAQPGDGCDDCRREAGWSCSGSPSACTLDTPEARCGNGILETGEECDDGRLAEGDGCDPGCRADPGWVCRGSPSVCVPATAETCGNGLLDAGEDCDDGNTVEADGCDELCIEEPSWLCRYEPSECLYADPALCGDGVVHVGEVCDDGNRSGQDGCDEACRVEVGFVCSGQPSLCRSGSTESTCGDGRIGPGESCDDGRRAPGDGCDEECQVEPTFSCVGEPSRCTAAPRSCGNGALDLGEACDDGNRAGGDGCSAKCELEHERPRNNSVGCSIRGGDRSERRNSVPVLVVVLGMLAWVRLRRR